MLPCPALLPLASQRGQEPWRRATHEHTTRDRCASSQLTPPPPVVLPRSVGMNEVTMEAMRERIIGAVSPYVEIESPELVEVSWVFRDQLQEGAATSQAVVGSDGERSLRLRCVSLCQPGKHPCVTQPVLPSLAPLPAALQVAVTTDVELGAIYSGESSGSRRSTHRAHACTTVAPRPPCLAAARPRVDLACAPALAMARSTSPCPNQPRSCWLPPPPPPPPPVAVPVKRVRPSVRVPMNADGEFELAWDPHSDEADPASQFPYGAPAGGGVGRVVVGGQA